MPYLAHISDCTGCSACVSICPQKCLQMEQDEYGFFQPVLRNHEQCIDCGLCGKVCPIQTWKRSSSGTTEAYAAFSKKEEMRKESSSGGIFSELAMEILKEGGVVYGAAYGDEFSVHHICVEDTENLAKLRGAKYAQSNLDDIFPQIKSRLSNDQQVLFVGTPCQVAGLKSFLQKEYEGLLTIDFVCHGVPSPAVWEQYVRYRAAIDNAGCFPEQINLRSKCTGWSDYQYSNVYQYENGKRYTSKSGDDLYMRFFIGNYINRASCANCHFKGYDRVSDITLGDFWGIWDIAPEMDDDKGTSLVLLHSDKGKNAFRVIGERIRYQKVTLEQASAQNLSLLEASPSNLQREKVILAAIAGKFEEVKNVFPLPQHASKVTLRARLAGKVRSVFR